MEIAGFESTQYFVFVVSDLSQNQVLQLAAGLAPALNDALRTTAPSKQSSLLPGALFQINQEMGI
jgi:hypothetical protein